jgi:hypothetical protein
MFRMTTLKISLFSAFATLFLLVAMLASTGTASAHTASCQPQQINSHCTPRPQLNVYDVMWTNGGCDEMFVKGASFAPGQVTLAATQNGSPLTVSPSVETADVNGNFSGDLFICSDVSSSTFTHTFLVGTDSLGHKSNKVVV